MKLFFSSCPVHIWWFLDKWEYYYCNIWIDYHQNKFSCWRVMKGKITAVILCFPLPSAPPPVVDELLTPGPTVTNLGGSRSLCHCRAHTHLSYASLSGHALCAQSCVSFMPFLLWTLHLLTLFIVLWWSSFCVSFKILGYLLHTRWGDS